MTYRLIWTALIFWALAGALYAGRAGDRRHNRISQGLREIPCFAGEEPRASCQSAGEVEDPDRDPRGQGQTMAEERLGGPFDAYVPCSAKTGL